MQLSHFVRIAASSATAAVLLASCKETQTSVHVTEDDTRRLTLHDHHHQGNIKDRPPLGWRRLLGTQFRALNYVAGPNEEVEIVMGDTGGTVLENANRWLGQFGLTPLQSEQFLGKTEMLGRPAFLVEAGGNFAPGMGKDPVEGYSLIGVLRPSGGNIISLKMTGPTEAVEALRDEFFKYLESLESVEIHMIPEPDSSEAKDSDTQ